MLLSARGVKSPVLAVNLGLRLLRAVSSVPAVRMYVLSLGQHHNRPTVKSLSLSGMPEPRLRVFCLRSSVTDKWSHSASLS